MVLVLHREPAVPRNPLPLLRVAQEVPQGPTVPTRPDSPHKARQSLSGLPLVSGLPWSRNQRFLEGLAFADDVQCVFYKV